MRMVSIRQFPFVFLIVIPERREVASPESISADLWLWIPGLRTSSASRNDGECEITSSSPGPEIPAAIRRAASGRQDREALEVRRPVDHRAGRGNSAARHLRRA